ncbi:MAG: ribose-5-phosphate isomerase RpiA [Alphaproteobacteria bacterium]|nr:ribose-5-phosphate isomerase RpiA [Alphaproteobacteria bacterium]
MHEIEKKAAGKAAAAMVEDGMLLGLGTGSTVDFFLRALGERVADGLMVRGVASSLRTAHLCKRLHIEMLDLASVNEVDLCVDGADELDRQFHMIKGGGGALLREKMVASIARHVTIIVDSTKLVTTLGAFPLPVEVNCFGYQLVERRLRALGIAPRLRLSDNAPYLTDNGHYILDCSMGAIPDPVGLEAKLKSLTGVIDTGLFLGLCHTAIIGRGTEVEIRRRDFEKGTSSL